MKIGGKDLGIVDYRYGWYFVFYGFFNGICILLFKEKKSDYI